MPPQTRPRCTQCLRPLTHCLCAHVQKLCHRTAVLVLQHPDEQKHPLNTARLAVMGLKQAECWIGETFDLLPQRLAQARSPALLFPGPQACAPPAWAAHHPDRPLPDLLIVPDGTWRQAGRLVRLNPSLAEVPRVVLTDVPPSRYRLRQARRDDAVSTIEAIALTLSSWEPDTDFASLLVPFKAMIENQIRAMGEQAFARHQQLSAQKRTNHLTD